MDTLTFSQVKELVSNELFARYDRLLLQASLESMPDILYCSRKTCGCAVVVDAESSMACCPSCHYVFCIFCKQVYHGISPCRIKEGEISESISPCKMKKVNSLNASLPVGSRKVSSL